MYKIIYRKSAVKALSKMPRKIAEKFTGSFSLLADNQEDGLDIKKLEGREGFRLRIGSYRAIYHKINEIMVIDVINVGIRGDIYK
ncbi:MAG: type II toxin-antitoxin system RelE/ParE family toxin [Methylococcales bacterium]|nr:MAG: type II toxin-antitoxin system RelE/ParE family toxin [Methylococcales bacterium]